MMKQQVYIRTKWNGMEAKVLEFKPREKSYYYDVIVAELSDGSRMFVMVTDTFDKHNELFTRWEDDGSILR